MLGVSSRREDTPRAAGAWPTTHKHVAEKARLQVSLLRRAEALDIGDGASGLLVPRAALQDCPSVRGPSRGRGGAGGAVVGLGGGVGRVLPAIKS